MSDSLLIRAKNAIGGHFDDNLLTEDDLVSVFKVILGYDTLELPDPPPEKDPRDDIEEQAIVQAKIIAMYVQNALEAHLDEVPHEGG